MKKYFYKELAFIIAMFTNSLAISLLVKSVFGVSTLSSLPLVLSKVVSFISFGMMNFIVQAILLIVLIIITRQPKVGYIFSFVIAFVFGIMVDSFEIIIRALSNEFIFRIIYFIIGWLMISFGAALFIKSSMPLMPFDGFIRDLSIYLNISVKKVKTSCDLIFVSSALMISICLLKHLVGVGIGTIYMALFTGGLTQKYLDILDKKYNFITKTNLGKELEKLSEIKTK